MLPLFFYVPTYDYLTADFANRFVWGQNFLLPEIPPGVSDKWEYMWVSDAWRHALSKI
jgi:hypothetical protein